VLSVTLRIIWHNFLRGIWHNATFLEARHDRIRIVPARVTRRRTAKDFAGGVLNEKAESRKKLPKRQSETLASRPMIAARHFYAGRS